MRTALLSVASALLLQFGSIASAATSDEAFLLKVHAINQSEIRVGELAVTRAQREDVKDLAKQLIADHNASDEVVADVAAPLQLSLDLNRLNISWDVRTVQIKGIATYERLRMAKSADFDKKYIIEMINSHQDALNTLTESTPNLTADATKTLADETRVKVKEHLDLLRKLQAVGE